MILRETITTKGEARNHLRKFPIHFHRIEHTRGTKENVYRISVIVFYALLRKFLLKVKGPCPGAFKKNDDDQREERIHLRNSQFIFAGLNTQNKKCLSH